MASNDDVWCDALKWSERWVEDEALPGGAQGNAYIVRKRVAAACDANAKRFFLKELKSNKDIERRARMFREAAALSTYAHPGIPCLVESNASHHADSTGKFKLYVVTELIEGSNLQESITKNGPLNFQESMALALRLVDIVGYCHQQESTHRDIKPANIILAGGVPAAAVLVDFGLSHHSFNCDEHATELEQELGNRFLRLPELSAMSVNKRDPRSDLTFVAGILFYVLTGRAPAQLEDERGRRPHQRDDVELNLRIVAQSKAMALLTFFDQVFSPRLENRFGDAQAMKHALDKIKSADSIASGSTETFQKIRERLEAQGAEEKAYQSQWMKLAGNRVEQIVRTINAQLGDHLEVTASGWYKEEPAHHWKNIGLDTPGTHYPRFRPCFDFQILGSEFVISVFDEQRQGSGRPIWRTSADSINLSDWALEQSIHEIFAEGLSRIV
ncbi:MAG TPA: protein kinase [Rhodocyclaceae bacterium]|nr:protein kinase [Rhodocyclaceae bacterium]